MQYRCSTVVKYGLIKIDEQTLCDGGTEDICEVKLLYDFACDGTFNTFERKTIIDSLEELEQAVEDIKRDGVNTWFWENGKFYWNKYMGATDWRPNWD